VLVGVMRGLGGAVVASRHHALLVLEVGLEGVAYLYGQRVHVLRGRGGTRGKREGTGVEAREVKNG